MSSSQSSSSVASHSPASTLTSPPESNPLSDEISKASTESVGLDSDKDIRPTLLNIPQELRDKIFEYVYGNSGADDGRVDVVVVKIRPPWSRAMLASHHILPSREMLASHHTLPSRDTLLICRQLYSEMHGMRKALYRQFWTANTFHVSYSQHSEDLEGRQATFYDGLLHVKHFVLVIEKSDYRYEADINLAGESTTATARLTWLRVTPHLQLEVGQDMQDDLRDDMIIYFYREDGRRRALDGQKYEVDSLESVLDVEEVLHIFNSHTHWSLHNRTPH
jgi:hypothetical protein